MYFTAKAMFRTFSYYYYLSCGCSKTCFHIKSGQKEDLKGSLSPSTDLIGAATFPLLLETSLAKITFHAKNIREKQKLT